MTETTKFTFTSNDSALPFKTKCSREKRNQEAIQQSILLGLLTQFYTITLEKPTKKSNVTEQIPKIVSIVIDGEEFDFDNFVKGRFLTEINQEFSSQQERIKSLRIFNRNIHIFTNNFLFDLCIENGFLFHSHLSKMSKNKQRIEYFDAVFYEGKLIMDNNGMVSIGKNLCKYFTNLLNSDSKSRTAVIHAGNAEISEILGMHNHPNHQLNSQHCQNSQHSQIESQKVSGQFILNVDMTSGLCSSPNTSFINCSSPKKLVYSDEEYKGFCY